MRYTISTFLLLILIQTICVAQKFTLQELIKLSKGNDDECDTYVSKKGYRLLVSEEEAERRGKSSCIESSYLHGGIEKYGEYFIYSGYCTNGNVIKYMTASSTEYVAFKTDLKNLGYAYDSTFFEDGDKYISYKNKDGNIVYLVSLCTTNYLGKNVNAYRIEIIRLK